MKTRRRWSYTSRRAKELNNSLLILILLLGSVVPQAFSGLLDAKRFSLDMLYGKSVSVTIEKTMDLNMEVISAKDLKLLLLTLFHCKIFASRLST